MLLFSCSNLIHFNGKCDTDRANIFFFLNGELQSTNLLQDETRFMRQQLTSDSTSSLTCPECKKSYSSKHSLKRHMDAHRGYFPYMCYQCIRGFQNRAAYNAHLVTKHNMEEMKVACPVCEIKFTRQDNMKAHLQLSHGPFKSLADLGSVEKGGSGGADLGFRQGKGCPPST